MLKTKVKASAITNLTDARYFAAWEVQWLGFNFQEGTADYIDPTTMKAIKEWVDGVEIIGEFGMHTAEYIKSGIELLDLDGVQVNQFLDHSELQQLVDVKVIQEIVIEAGTNAEDIQTLLAMNSQWVNYFLLNFSSNKVELSAFGDAALADICEEYPVLLSANINKETIDAVLNDIKPYGIEVKGGEEEKVGYKSFDDLDDLFEELETFEE